MNQPCRRQTAAGRFSGNLMTKVTVYFRTIRSGFNSDTITIITCPRDLWGNFMDRWGQTTPKVICTQRSFAHNNKAPRKPYNRAAGCFIIVHYGRLYAYLNQFPPKGSLILLQCRQNVLCK
jgi:hypothetical protein